MKLNGTFWVGLGLLMLVSLVSCQSGEETAVINTPTIVPTSTAVPTQTLLPPTATMETTPLPTATLTPLPTFAPDELETAVADLLANPMNCDVPCWWWAIPGVTSLKEIEHVLSPYNFHVSDYKEDREVVFLLVEIEYIEEKDDFETGIVYNFSSSILTGVTAYAPSVSEVLAKYGQPDEVWLATGITPGTIPVRLNLVYPKEGMAFGYTVHAVDDIHENSVLKGCFENEEVGLLRLITPYNSISYKDFSPIFEEDRRYLLFEELAQTL